MEKIVVSLDVHTDNIYAYAAATGTGKVLLNKNFRDGYDSVLRAVKKIGPKKHTTVILEAGNQGFAPFRFFQRAGYACRLIAPSSIPRKGKWQKTDKDDAIQNLRYHNAHVLKYVDVPDPEDEDSRECLRYRYQLVWRVLKQKQKIHSLAKRSGKFYTETKTLWTKAHRRWLKKLTLFPATRSVLDCMLDELRQFENNLEQLDSQLGMMVENNPKYKKHMVLYQTLPGIGPVTALTLILEGRDLKRFPTPGSLMNYTGLLPGKYASGGRDPALRITKAGNKYLRTAMVSCAKFFRDSKLLRSQKEIAAYPAELKDFINRCQVRLYHRYKYLTGRGKHSNKARVAVAREMCGYLWELMTKIEPYLSPNLKSFV